MRNSHTISLAIVLLNSSCAETLPVEADAVEFRETSEISPTSSRITPARPCSDEMALIPPQPGARASVPWFCLDRTEVSVVSWRACVEAGACTWPEQYDNDNLRPPVVTSDARPIAFVGQSEGMAYCQWAGKRLPTREEWEWAYRSARSDYNAPWGVWRGAQKASQSIKEAFEAGICMPPPGKPSLTGPCPVGTHLFDRTAQNVMDMVGNVSEWTATVRRGSAYYVVGADFATRDARLYVPGQAAAFASMSSMALGVRCAKDPATSLPELRGLPCPEPDSRDRAAALAMLREYHSLLAAGRHDEAALWTRSRLDRAFLEEARLSLDVPLEDLAELFTFSGARTKSLSDAGRLAPLPREEEIELRCENWIYTPFDRSGAPVLRLLEDSSKAVPFCLSRRREGWFLSCL